MADVTFSPAGITVDVPAGSPLLHAARFAGLFVETPCGGRGTCLKCRAQITENGITKDVLICQTMAGNLPVTVHLLSAGGGEGQFETFEDPGKYLHDSLQKPRESFLKTITIKTALPALLDGLSDADRFSKAFIKAAGCLSIDLPLNVLAILPEKLREADGEVSVYYYIENNTAKIVCLSASRKKTYGIAVDIGTTTVSLWLVDMESVKVIGTLSAYNAQVECGLDVISRINYAKKSLPELRSAILKTINDLIISVCKGAEVDPADILCASMAGNTTMVHLFLGLKPEYIRLSPYTPAVFLPQVYSSGQVGISVCENAPVLFAPAVGSYVGGDITSGLLCTGLASVSGELVLFIDIGTNGEIVLGNDEFIFACACSAGPAFEGGGIKHGVRARKGAVERVTIGENGKAEIFTIGGAPPTGICGSGIISAAAELFRKGIIDSAGKFPQKNSEFTLCGTPVGEITISETDIDNFIRTKGAIFSACQTLLQSAGFSFADVDRVCVAGGFGRFLDLEDARTIGLLPRLPDGKYSFLGNTSIIGAYLALVSEEHRVREHELAGRITYMDLSSESGYMDQYTAALFLPHTDRKLFE